MTLEQFHPAVSAWFEETFGAPTDCQKHAWPAVTAGKHTLIAAPTGSGKTLAAFMAAIDALVHEAMVGELPDATRVLYVSPLKALSNDVQRNLELPLEGIGRKLLELGYPDAPIRSFVRTGDTPAALRTAMAKRPPHIVVTTPESFYILLTSESGRRMLKGVETVIVDEIHAVVGSKRGSHLALSLERLEHLAERPPIRIGLSATQRPIEKVARFLLGASGSLEDCAIIDGGFQRRLDLALELPDSPLEALLSGEAAGEIYDKIAALVESHSTTLVFVNTRRMAERVARHLSERLGDQHVTSHHGSLSREQRLSAEVRLKAGELKALVATASLELGIDIGDVDLVCQIGTTGAIAAFLQRIGRSGHSLGGIPKGRLFPTSRDELIECIALIDAVRRGELDRLTIPEKPMDVLAQQIVAMVACEEWEEEALFHRVRRAYPYRHLTRAAFDAVVEMLAEGFSTHRGRRNAHLHRDMIHGRLRPRRGARLTAVTCGGAIPDNAEYRVILEPSGDFIGTVDEDFAIESLAGDIFQLGNASWRILRLEGGKLRVEDARHQPPSIPFWFGEAPGRTHELSRAVSDLREAVTERLGAEGDTQGAETWLQQTVGIGQSAAEQAVTYLHLAKAALGVLPSFDTLVLERFFDESGGMQLILHAPYGSRVNRAWGLALRKRFCRSFNFELQAAATENAIILSLGTSQSFPLAEVARHLHSGTVKDLLVQALLAAPMFTVRWRWNCTCALAVRRFQNGRKTPPYLVRMQAEDLVTSVFPDQLACLENISGDREIPDHPLVNQTIADCLTEAMDIDRLIAILQRIENGALQVIARDLVEPSPLAAEILTARNYAFLDGAPAEERRTRAVESRRWLDPAAATDLGRLDPGAIERVCREAWPEAANADELYDALATLGFIAEEEADRTWPPLFRQLIDSDRGAVMRLPQNSASLWVAAEQIPRLRAVHPTVEPEPQLPLPALLAGAVRTREEAIVELLRLRLGCLGPQTVESLSSALGLTGPETEAALLALENQGLVLRGRFSPNAGSLEWCDRKLLARIHRHTITRLRQAVEPVSGAEFMAYLLRWQHVHPDTQLQGADALRAALAQLEGFEAAAAAWESDLLSARLKQYDPAWLDTLCLSGRAVWLRLSDGCGGQGPIRTSPIAILSRRHLKEWLACAGAFEVELTPNAQQVADALERRGALFFDELEETCRLLKSPLETALAELAAKGLVTADSFNGLRALLLPEQKKHRYRRLRPLFGIEEAGRWTLLRRRAESGGDPETTPSESLAHAAKALLRRYGVVFKALLARESCMPPWRALLSHYRQMEMRAEIRGGRFVAGQFGEQFALPEAVEALRKAKKTRGDGEMIAIAAGDPLNLAGIVSPGPKVGIQLNNRILLRDGITLALQAGGEVRYLEALSEKEQWQIKTRLIRRPLRPVVDAGAETL